MLEPNDAIDYALSLASTQAQRDVDVYFSSKAQLDLQILKGKVEKVDQSTTQGMGIRVVDGGKTGIAYTERLEKNSIDKAFAAARDNAALMDPTEVVLNETPVGVPDPDSLKQYNPDLEAVSLRQLTEFGLEAEAAALAEDARVKHINYLVVGREASQYTLASSHGIRYTQRGANVGAYCGAYLEDGDSCKTGGELWQQRVWDPSAARGLGATAVRNGARLLGAKPIPSTRIPVVFDQWTAPRMMGFYLGNFSGEAAQKELSRLKGQLGEMIAVPELSLIDDPHMEGARGSCYLDDEGTPTNKMSLIEDGRFTNFLYHIESARKEGKDSTGHGARGYGSSISTGSHNLVIPTGKHDLEALYAMPERCLLVTDLEGGSGCNSVSGDISIGVQGFLVENGEKKHPVDSMTIAGNFYDMLKNIRALGNTYQPNITSRFIPAMLVEGFALSG